MHNSIQAFRYEDQKVDFNTPTTVHELRSYLRNYFANSTKEELKMSRRVINEVFFDNRCDSSYLGNILNDFFNAEVIKITDQITFKKEDFI